MPPLTSWCQQTYFLSRHSSLEVYFVLLLLWLFTRLGCLGANTGTENFIVLSMYLYGIPDGIQVT